MTVYGRNSVEEALAEGLNIQEILVERERKSRYSRVLESARERKIPVRLAENRDLEAFSRSRKHQGIAAAVILPANIHEVDQDSPDWSSMNHILALDGITDTGNLGAIIRSALLMGMDAVVLPRDASARITPAAIRASAGAVYKQPVYYIDNLNYLIDELQEAGYTIYGLAGGKENPGLEQADLAGKVCLVLGAEDKGIRKSVRRKCSGLLSIPTTSRLDSLNAGVAAAIAMWELYKVSLNTDQSRSNK